MDANGSVVIEVDADVSDANKKIARLKTEIQSLKVKISEKEYKHNAIVEQIQATEEGIKKAKDEIESFRKAYLENGTEDRKDQYDRSLENLTKMNTEYEKLVANADKLAASIAEDELNLEAMKYAGGQLQAEVNSAEQAEAQTVDTSAAEQAEAKLESIFDQIKAYAKEGSEGIKLGLTGILDGIKSMAAKGVSSIGELSKSFSSFVKSGLKKLISYSGKAAKSLLSVFKGSNKTNSSFASGIKTMLKYSLGIRGLYELFRKLRSAMTEGFKNLAQYSDTTNKSISMVMSALTQLKNSLATAFAPILTIVAPILTQFISMLSTAADYVARLTAALTGQTTYTRAVKVQEDYAASLEGTAQAADDAAGSLAGFDEINTITTENTASSGGSSGSVSPSDMFEEVAIEPISFDSWGQAFDAFLDSILNSGIPKLKEGLSSLAGWLNTFAANLYEMFTFPGIQDKVALIGYELAVALNDLVNQIDWATLGGALGAGLNTALGFLVAFIYTFDWMNLGASLATMVNNAVAEIDWYNVGMLLWAKFKIAIETLAGFLLNLDMAQLADAASKIVIGFFDSMVQTLQTIDWRALGTQIGTFLSSIDWWGVLSSVATAIGEAILAALESIIGFIEGLSPEILLGIGVVVAAIILGIPAFIASIGSAIVAAIAGLPAIIIAGIAVAIAAVVLYIKAGGGDVIAGFLEGILEGIKNIGSWLKEHVVDPFVNGFKSLFGIHSPSTVMQEQGGYIMDGLKNGITGKIASVIATFTGLKEKIQSVFSNITIWFRDKFSEAWQAVKDVFSSGGAIFEGIKEGILEGLKVVVNALISGINQVISIPFNGINSALRKIRDAEILGIRPFSWISTISIPQIPRLATGAVIPPNREFMAVLGDQKHGTNIEAPEDLIRKIVREESGVGNSEVVALLQAILQATKDGKTIMVGKTVLGRTAASAINDLTISSGKSVFLY